MKISAGIDIGGTNTKIVLASEHGKALISRQMPTPTVPDKSSEKLDALLIRNMKDFLDDSSTKKALSEASDSNAIEGIGIGVAGLIDRQNGTVLQSPNIPALDGLRLREKFETAFSLPVVLENDANIYAYN